MSGKKKSIALSAFRIEINASDPGFRKRPVEDKFSLWQAWLQRQPELTPKQVESWSKVNPWLKRDRSHEGR